MAISDSIDELILGSDWLVANSCKWDFGQGTLQIRNNVLKLLHRRVTNAVRRIYVAKDVIIPPKHQANIPVKLAAGNLHVANKYWALEAKKIAPEVVVAPTESESLLRIVVHTPSTAVR